jgi:hypothetical protein
MRKSIIWFPVLFVGSMVCWTLAVGLGGLSLVSVTADSIPCRSSLIESAPGDPSPGDFLRNDDGAGGKDTTFQSITVKLGDSLELTDQPGGAVTVDLVSDHPSAGDVDESSAQANDPGRNAAADADRRGSGRRSRTDQGPGETAF